MRTHPTGVMDDQNGAGVSDFPRDRCILWSRDLAAPAEAPARAQIHVGDRVYWKGDSPDSADAGWFKVAALHDDMLTIEDGDTSILILRNEVGDIACGHS